MRDRVNDRPSLEAASTSIPAISYPSLPAQLHPSRSSNWVTESVERPNRAVETCVRSADYYVGLGTSRSLWAISSIETSRKVRTLALFTKRAGRYMSHTQASPMETS